MLKAAFDAIGTVPRAWVLVAILTASLAWVLGPHAAHGHDLALYAAAGLGLLAGGRLAWTALAGAERGPWGRPLVPFDPRAFREPEVAAPSGTPGGAPADAQPAPAAGEPVAAEDRPDRARADPARVLDDVRSRMDEVSYRPGSPNVLSMTKYLRDGSRPDGAAGGEGGPDAERAAIVPEAGESRISRIDRGEETVLAISGVLDALTAPEVRSFADALVAEGRARVTVDLSSLRMLDSAGVGVLVGLYKRCAAFGGTVRVTGARDQPLAVLKLLRLDRVLAP